MELRNIYKPIRRELAKVEEILADAFKRTRSKSILKVTNYLLESSGKRLRPALVILSAKATSTLNSQLSTLNLTKIAATIELIHVASLIHDDVVDHARLRHNKASINTKWGEDVSIALGDYLYSLAFELISSCGNPDILDCISQATKAMCEGELTQICERNNTGLLKERNMIIVKKKTAELFAASCEAGAILSNCPPQLERALRGFGLDFGIAFQIIDDYLDVVGEEACLGKAPGQDIAVGEMTLPLSNLMESFNKDERLKLRRILKTKGKNNLKKIRQWLQSSGALSRTKKVTLYYINSAKKRLKALPDSAYRKSLADLADFILRRGFSS